MRNLRIVFVFLFTFNAIGDELTAPTCGCTSCACKEWVAKFISPKTGKPWGTESNDSKEKVLSEIRRMQKNEVSLRNSYGDKLMYHDYDRYIGPYCKDCQPKKGDHVPFLDFPGKSKEKVDNLEGTLPKHVVSLWGKDWVNRIARRLPPWFFDTTQQLRDRFTGEVTKDYLNALLDARKRFFEARDRASDSTVAMERLNDDMTKFKNDLDSRLNQLGVLYLHIAPRPIPSPTVSPTKNVR